MYKLQQLVHRQTRTTGATYLSLDMFEMRSRSSRFDKVDQVKAAAMLHYGIMDQLVNADFA